MREILVKLRNAKKNEEFKLSYKIFFKKLKFKNK